MPKPKKNYNLGYQFYKGLPLQLIERHDYHVKAAKRFTIAGTNQNVWIPNKHLLEDGTIKANQDLFYVFTSKSRQLELAGYMMGFIPIEKGN